jgi:membrane-associated phospholipid phosphatase
MHRLLRQLQRFRPETVLLVVFLALLAALRGVYGGSLHVDKLTAKAPFGASTVLAGLAALGEVRRARESSRRPALLDAVWRVLADWLPAVLCLLVYENMHDVVRLVHPDTLDAPLAAADAWLFGGVQPTLWLQRWSWPWLVDVAAFAYSSYFFTPTILAATLYAAGRRAEFHELMRVVIACFYAGFLGYVLVPAVGPIHWLRGAYTDPVVLHGYVYDTAEALMNDLRSINRDCFPSLHTAISTVTLVCAWRWRRLTRAGRALAAAYLPLTLMLWFATVYLRYHWVVDVLAGWVLAAAALAVVPRLVARWQSSGRAGAPAHAP